MWRIVPSPAVPQLIGKISIESRLSAEGVMPVARRKQTRKQLPTLTKNKALRTRITRTGQKMVSIQNTLRELLRRAAPGPADKTVSWTAVDLASLWEVSVNHQRHNRLLLNCSYPKDRHKIENLLTEIRVNLLSQGADSLSTLQKGLLRIISAVCGAKSSAD
jgi:hypothetical protein